MRFKKINSGFTLIEVMAALSLLTAMLVAVPGSLVAYKYIAVYSKHKVQATYVAQRILEEQRRKVFSTLATMNYGAVSIDNKSTFNTAADDFMGTAAITVTSLDTYRKKVQVEVSWQERTPAGMVTKREFCTTDIANEAQLN